MQANSKLQTLKPSLQEVCNKILDIINKYQLNDKNIALAVSGGADSMLLLYACILLKDYAHFSVFHVNHGLRKASNKEEEYLKNFCNSNNIIFYSKKLSHLSCNDSGVELKARQERYFFFKEIMEKFNIACVFTAHHLNDNTETVLMNISRGAGLNGLVGIKEKSNLYNVDVIRPLLSFSKLYILNLIKQNNIEYFEDETNSQAIYSRNKLRLNIIPNLLAMYPSLDRSIYRLSSMASCDNDYFSTQVQKLINKYAYISEFLISFPKSVFKNLHEAIAGRIIIHLHNIALNIFNIRTNNNEDSTLLSFDNIKNVYNGIMTNKSFYYDLNGGVLLSSEYTHIHFTFPKNVSNNALCLAYPKFMEGENAFLSLCSSSKFNGKTIQCISKELLNDCVLRHKQKDDIIKPFGMNGTKSLKRYFVDKHIDKSFRPHIPVLAIDNKVLWVLGVGCSQDCVFSSQSSISLSVNGYMPWIKE